MTKVILISLTFFCATTVHALELSDRISFGAGIYDAFHRAKALTGRVEFRSHLSPTKLEDLALNPILGIAVATNGATYAYTGARLEIPTVGSLRISLAAGFGGYTRGNGIDLGGAFIFHGGADITWQAFGNNRIGLGFWHLSNAYTQRINPGTEYLLANFEMPL